jgi:acyl transferase domain-containing protein
VIRALVVCPGRGSYGARELGSLRGFGHGVEHGPGHGVGLGLGAPGEAGAIVAELDALRASLGRPTVSELDAAERFSPATHLAGENASLLTFVCSAVDLAAIDRQRVRIEAVAGNSMGFYTALYASGALDLASAARLVETMGQYQAGNVIGGQVVYPLVDEDWHAQPDLTAAAHAALAIPGVYVSIWLGGSIVFGASEAARPALLAALPKIRRGEREYPLPLALHSAFHTPLMAATAERAQHDLADLPFGSPAVDLVAGDGRVHRPWADPEVLRRYTLSAQVTEPFDLSLCIATALGEVAPDALVLVGPGDTLGASIAQILIARGFRGLRDRRDFVEAQAGPAPPLLSMSRPDQRAKITRVAA